MLLCWMATIHSNTISQNKSLVLDIVMNLIFAMPHFEGCRNFCVTSLHCNAEKQSESFQETILPSVKSILGCSSLSSVCSLQPQTFKLTHQNRECIWTQFCINLNKTIFHNWGCLKSLILYLFSKFAFENLSLSPPSLSDVSILSIAYRPLEDGAVPVLHSTSGDILRLFELGDTQHTGNVNQQHKHISLHPWIRPQMHRSTFSATYWPVTFTREGPKNGQEINSSSSLLLLSSWF